MLLAIGEDSVTSFGKRCGIGESTLRSYLRGAAPRLDKLLAITESAGVNIEWLATGKGPMRPGERQGEIKCEHESLKLHRKGHLFEKNPGFDSELLGQIFSQLSDFKENNPDCLTKEKELDVVTIAYSLVQPEVRDEAKLICSILISIINGERQH